MALAGVASVMFWAPYICMHGSVVQISIVRPETGSFISTACFSLPFSPRSTKLWSYQLSIGASAGSAFIRSALAPIGRSWRKSKPVPSTEAFSVGIRPLSVFVYWSAKICSSWPSTLPLDSPARFQ